jgi:large exoprotein involved in heme utilization and adhesion
MTELMPDNAGVIAFPPALYAGTLTIGLLLNVVFPIGLLPRLIVLVLGAQISTETEGEGAGVTLTVNATSVRVFGSSADGSRPSGLKAETENTGDAGDLRIDTGNLIVSDGAEVSASTIGEGAGGTLTVNATEEVRVFGTSVDGRVSSGLFAGTENIGKAGDLRIDTGNLIVSDGAVVTTGTSGEGAGGTLTVNATEEVRIIGTSVDGRFRSGLATATITSGNGGDLTLSTRNLTIEDGGFITSNSSGTGIAGDINLNIGETLQANDGRISTRASQSSGGAIEITAGNIRLRGDSDIRTDVNNGTGGGGNINLDVSFIQNNLATLAQNPIDTETLTANSCIARRERTTGSFIVTGNDSLPKRPGTAGASSYATGTVQTIESGSRASNESNRVLDGDRPWKKGDPVIEPTGVYRLPNGQLIVSRECSQ